MIRPINGVITNCITLLICFGILFQQAQSRKILQKRTVIKTNLKLNYAMAFSPLDPYVAVGSESGETKVYNYQTGKLIKQLKEQQGQIIVSIVWQNDKNGGLVTVSSNDTHSIAIQRDRHSFQSIYEWNFQEPILQADSTSDRFDSFLAFKFYDKISQYKLRTRQFIANYGENRIFLDFAFSSNHKFLFAGSSKYLYIYRCDTRSGQFLGNETPITDLSTNKYDNEHSTVIYKRSDGTFWAYDPSSFINYTIPSQQMNHYYYCQEEYIIGISKESQIIKIYSSDGKFAQYASIEDFSNRNVDILSLKCGQGYLSIADSQGSLTVYQIHPKNNDQDGISTQTCILIGIGVLVIAFIMYFIGRKKLCQKKTQQYEQSLIDSKYYSVQQN